ncbi:MAG: class I SAM-dependent RNA methyltransferase [Chloroflexi bacterium]|nr:class I SAM-dependent RNA methyltransferase [Chloroflexota bacterium]
MLDRPRKPLEIELTGFAAGGKAVGRAPDGRVAFVDYAIPGERVLAEVTEEAPSYIEATTVEVREPSELRVEPRCQYFGRCGGCQLQHVAYGEQLRLKTGVVRDQLRRIGRFEDEAIEGVLREMIGMADPWAYRNHMRFTVRRDGDIGFMEHGSHRFLRIDHCEIALPAANRVLQDAQGRTMQTRALTVRAGEHSGELLVQPKLRWRPHRRGNTRSGQPHYHELLRGARYRVSSPAFFQVNSRQAERLIELVVARARAVQPRLVADAYSGVGTFAVALAQVAPDVVTIEYSAAAGDDAEVNLAPYDNVRRIVGTVEEQLPALDPAPDVVVVDPPRAGLDASVIDAIVDSRVRRLVYVSCDPATLARDLRRLADGGMALGEVQPIDMFPHTQHIECISTLDRATS